MPLPRARVPGAVPACPAPQAAPAAGQMRADVRRGAGGFSRAGGKSRSLLRMGRSVLLSLARLPAGSEALPWPGEAGGEASGSGCGVARPGER